MGANTFIQTAAGSDVRQAFTNERDQEAFLNGSGGYSGTMAEKSSYVVISTTPMWESDATKLASKLIDDSDPRIDDKWGPAGAIACCNEYRTETVVVEGTRGRHDPSPDWEALATAKVKVKRGESVASVRPQSVTTLGTVQSATVEVRIRRAEAGVLSYKELSVVVEGPGQYSPDFRERVERAVAAKLKLAAGKSIASVNVVKSEPKKVNRATAIGKGRVTRYVITGMTHGMAATLGSGVHNTFDTGFDTLVEAKAYLRAASKVELKGMTDVVSLAVEGITRAADGGALASATIGTASSTVTVKVQILTGRKPAPECDSWVFFGWASS